MLSVDNVANCFCDLSGCRIEKLPEVITLVMSAVREIEDAVDEEKLTDAAIPACEFAAACLALYDYVCREASREQLSITAAGNADNSGDFTHRIRAADELRKDGLSRIAWLMKGDSCFVFETM